MSAVGEHLKQYRVGADVGGTFTDVILIDDEGNITTRKVPSTPPNFDQAVTRTIDQLLRTAQIEGAAISEVAHGTTVATNAVLEHRGAKTALITTKGFRDVLELRRIRVPVLYDWFFDKPQELVERYLRFELTERISATGEVLIPPEEAELWQLKMRLQEEGVESIAVCLLHAYAFPQHEVVVGDFLRKHFPQVPVSLSFQVLPECKEYERTATTVVNAYICLVMRGYLEALRSELEKMRVTAPLLIMQSAGGLTPEDDAALRPVFVLESGPAAGVLAAGFTAEQVGLENVITLDMGGTTAKASMIEAGKISYSPQYEVGAGLSAGSRLMGGQGELVGAPSIDIAEVGAGGGSIASLDRAGGLRVGPRSAGAIPGPACYQRGGTQPTLTDANVVLGYIRPGKLADGQVIVHPEAARRAIHDHIAAPLQMDLLPAADGIHRIANARTMRALREVSTERGRDPRDFVLIAFGGSGPIHAAGLARELEMRRIIVPPVPGLFSALGLLLSGVEHHGMRSCLFSKDNLQAQSLQALREQIKNEMLAQFEREGYPAHQVTLRTSADVHFQGQTSDIRVPLSDEPITDSTVRTLCTDFETEHEQLYGHRSDPDNPIEVTAVRLVGQAGVRGHNGALKTMDKLEHRETSRKAYFSKSVGMIESQVIARHDLSGTMAGPLLIDEYDSTIVVPPDATAHLDEFGNVVMDLGPAF